MLNQKRRNLADLEEKYGIEIVISADLSIKNINDYRIEKSRVAKARPERVAATAAYAAAEPVADDDYEEAEDVEEDDDTEEEDTRSSERYNRRGRNNNRRRGRFNRRGQGRYSRRDNDEGEAHSESASASDVAHDEEPAKKKTWWKKLLG
jgi:ribonuclease E